MFLVGHTCNTSKRVGIFLFTHKCKKNSIMVKPGFK